VSIRGFLHTLRSLLLGETIVLPLAVAGTVILAAGLRLFFGDEAWWRDAAGPVVLLLVMATLSLSLRRQ
jgi:hypothetical protein